MQAFFRELWKASHIPPAICLAFLLLFFSFLPDLNRCRLPAVRTRDQAKALTRREAFRVFLVTAVYAVFAFWNLGNLASPESFVPMANRSVVLMPASAEAPAKLMLFTGVGQGEYSIEVSEDQQGWLPVASFRQDHVSVLKWNTVDLELDSPAAYLRLRWLSGTPWLGELVLFDGAGERIAFSCSEENLHDEGDLVPEKQTYHNSSYFDEIYHARTAWEHLHDIWPYELSHPPLGKELLSLGILLFGMTPFGWRFSGTLTGVLMLPVMYIFLKRLFGGRRIPLLGTVLLASGFLHYTQTRIATIDSFSVLFILLMYCFMYGWLSDDSPADLALCVDLLLCRRRAGSAVDRALDPGFCPCRPGEAAAARRCLPAECSVLSVFLYPDSGSDLLSLLSALRQGKGLPGFQRALHPSGAGKPDLYV